jgi:hypothetical protein
MNLPPGNSALKMHDGRRYKAARPGGKVWVEDRHVADINAVSGNGTAGLLTAGFREFTAGTGNGRWCRNCQPARLWNAWNASCPRCGSATEAEQPS